MQKATELWHKVGMEALGFKDVGQSLFLETGSIPFQAEPLRQRPTIRCVLEDRQGIGQDKASKGALVTSDATREIQHCIQLQDRLAVVGQLAAGIAHDFNHIMAVIVLYTQTVLRSMPDMPLNTRNRLMTVIQQAKRASDLVQQILDFSRSEAIERRPLDLVPLLKEQVRLLEHTLPKNIRISLSHKAGKYIVNTDPTQIQQIMLNLALNARDAMPQGGELCIRLEQVRVEDRTSSALPRMILRLGQGAEVSEWVRLTVLDTGTGIPPDVLPHIFEPFFTTKASGRGSGLGLTQVYDIVKQHEGEIEVQSQVGRGTTFAIYLPAS